MVNATDALYSFALNTHYEDIPEDVIHEMKRILIDGLGNALGGISSDKGKIGLSFAGKIGGTPEATVLGIGGKISAPMAAFVNSELLNSLDTDPIAHIPHCDPFRPCGCRGRTGNRQGISDGPDHCPRCGSPAEQGSWLCHDELYCKIWQNSECF